jgi:hypothetical protein
MIRKRISGPDGKTRQSNGAGQHQPANRPNELSLHVS